MNWLKRSWSEGKFIIKKNGGTDIEDVKGCTDRRNGYCCEASW